MTPRTVSQQAQDFFTTLPQVLRRCYRCARRIFGSLEPSSRLPHHTHPHCKDSHLQRRHFVCSNKPQNGCRTCGVVSDIFCRFAFRLGRTDHPFHQKKCRQVERGRVDGRIVSGHRFCACAVHSIRRHGVQ